MAYIRPATLEDRPACIAIAEMYPDTRSFRAPWFSGEEVFLESEDVWVLDEGGVAGFYLAKFKKRDYSVSLEYIAVAAPGNGMGVDLLEHLKTRVRLSGTHQVIKSKVGRRSRNFWTRNHFDLEENRGIWST
jgi:GNAT superfamily N-acetyltransferase